MNDELEQKHEENTPKKHRVVEPQAVIEITQGPEETNDIRYVPDVRKFVTGRLIGNPNYRPETIDCDGTVYSVVRDWHPSPKARENEYVFFTNLEASVQADGVQIPVCGFAIGHEVFIKTGLSRLWAAQKHNVACPALIVVIEGDRLEDFDRVENLVEIFGDVEWTDNEAPGLGWYYTDLSDRVSLDDPRFMENLF